MFDGKYHLFREKRNFDMRLGGISSVNFGRMAALSGTKEDVEAFSKKLSESGLRRNKDYMLEMATDLYESGESSGFCSSAVKEGKEVAFLFTGKDVYGRQHVLRSREAASRRMQMFVNLSHWSFDNLVSIIRADKRKDKELM